MFNISTYDSNVLNLEKQLSDKLTIPLPDDKILDWSKFKQIANDIFKVHIE